MLSFDDAYVSNGDHTDVWTFIINNREKLKVSTERISFNLTTRESQLISSFYDKLIHVSVVLELYNMRSADFNFEPTFTRSGNCLTLREYLSR